MIRFTALSDKAYHSLLTRSGITRVALMLVLLALLWGAIFWAVKLP
ncbi:hypothetical protein [Vibrio tritonius]